MSEVQVSNPFLPAVEYLAKMCDINDDTARRWIVAADTPRMIGGNRKIRARKSDLDALIQSKIVGGDA
ncbi:MAG: helix-turn-helix domain-containing protein [Pseudomonadaceae bacterium]|nr:helix-turn-helix domain-containing protein [Pseudomonadaceae bacterium]